MTVRLPDPRRRRVMEAKWDVDATSVARIREAGTEQWSVGFETPFRCCRFVGTEGRYGLRGRGQAPQRGPRGRTGDRPDPHRGARRVAQQRGTVSEAVAWGDS